MNDGMFNKIKGTQMSSPIMKYFAQLDYMRELAEIPPDQRCYCGWYRLGMCPHCPPGRTCADKLRDRGNSVPSSVCRCNDAAGKPL